MEKLLHIKSNNLKPHRGRVLIAEPLMDEFYFGRSVILLADHNEEGSFGLVMNKPTTTQLNQILEDFPSFDATVFIGGPVQTDNLYFIHTLGNEIPESSEILPGLFWGGELEVVREMMALGLINQSQIRFFLGYAGWSPLQIEEELERNAWLVSETTLHTLMKTRPEKLWSTCLQRMGPAYDLWRRFPLNPELN